MAEFPYLEKDHLAPDPRLLPLLPIAEPDAEMGLSATVRAADGLRMDFMGIGGFNVRTLRDSVVAQYEGGPTSAWVPIAQRQLGTLSSRHLTAVDLSIYEPDPATFRDLLNMLRRGHVVPFRANDSFFYIRPLSITGPQPSGPERQVIGLKSQRAWATHADGCMRESSMATYQYRTGWNVEPGDGRRGVGVNDWNAQRLFTRGMQAQQVRGFVRIDCSAGSTIAISLSTYYPAAPGNMFAGAGFGVLILPNAVRYTTELTTLETINLASSAGTYVIWLSRSFGGAAIEIASSHGIRHQVRLAYPVYPMCLHVAQYTGTSLLKFAVLDGSNDAQIV